jgi:hypothetical protein
MMILSLLLCLSLSVFSSPKSPLFFSLSFSAEAARKGRKEGKEGRAACSSYRRQKEGQSDKLSEHRHSLT